MATAEPLFIVSIEERFDPGSPIFNVIANQEQVTALELTAKRTGYEAVIRRADSFKLAMDWMDCTVEKKP